jgi:hypothetical protein
MESSGSVQSRPFVMVYKISGWIPAVLTNRVALSFKRLSIQCFVGTVMQLNVIFICGAFRPRCAKPVIWILNNSGNQHFSQVDSLLEGGPPKNFLPQVQSLLNSSIKKAAF